MTKRRQRLFPAVLLLPALLLGGCNQHLERRAPVHPVMPEIAEPRPVNGSIFAGAGHYALIEDTSARQVGDTLTVLLTENTDASKSSSTSAERTTDVNIGTPTVFGRVLDRLGTTGGVSTSIQGDSSFEADGAASQNNSLDGRLTVFVTHVYPNGLMRIEGEKFLTLNNGEEVLRVSGVVRPFDVSPENTVMSTQVANAEIVYSGGNGPTQDVNIAGLITRLFFSALTLL